MATIYLAGGCFWGAEKFFTEIHGVTETEVGYANGLEPGPVTYEQVCTGKTGHAEAVRVEYDPAVAPLAFILDLYYRAVDPTSVNRQGGDVGTQYRTGIYYTDEADLAIIVASIGQLQLKYDEPIAIEVLPLSNFVPAEEYHQEYLDKNPGGYCHIGKSKFAEAAAARPTAHQLGRVDD